MKKFLLLCLAWIAWLPTVAAQQVQEPRLHVLENGMRVITVEDRSSPVVSVVWSAHVGDSSEPLDFAGNSHYLEHLLLFRGTESYPGNEIGEWVEGRGGYFNGHTWYDYTTFEMMSSSADLEGILDRHEEMMFHGAFSGEDFETEKKAVFEELRSFLDQPSRYLVLASPYKMYPEETFYSRDTIGFIETIQAATVERVRDYYQSYYVPNNITLAIVGDIDTASVVRSVERRFAKYPAKPLPETLYSPVPMKDGITLVSEERELGKAYILMAFEGPQATTPERFPFALLVEYLAGGNTSLLRSNLVGGSKLLDEVFVSEWPRRYPHGWQLVYAETAPETASQAILSIWELLEQVTQQGIPEEEFELAKKRLINRHRLLMDDSFQVAYQLAMKDAHGDYRLFSDFEKQLSAVTRADVFAVANKYLTVEHSFAMTTFPEAAMPEGFEHEVRVGLEGLAASGSAVQTRQLDNGLALLAETRPGSAMESLTVAVRGGEVASPKPGVAEAVARMLALQTARQTQTELQNALDSQGLTLDSWVEADASYFSIQAPSGSTDKMARLMVEVLTEPKFDDEAWAAIKGEISAELERAQESPRSVAQGLMRSGVFEGTGYGSTIGQRLDSLNSLTLKDFNRFWERTYTTAEMGVSYSGPASSESLEAQLSSLDALGDKPVKPVSLSTTFPDSPQRFYGVMAGKTQASIYRVWPAPATGSRENVLWKLAQHALGGDLASRLWKLRQEEGLAYSVGASSAELNQFPLTYIYLTTAEENREEAINAIDREVNLFSAGMSEEELERVKVSWLAELNRVDRTTSRRSVRHARWWVQGSGEGRREELLRIISSVTLAEVNAVIKQVMNPEVYVYAEAGAVPE